MAFKMKNTAYYKKKMEESEMASPHIMHSHLKSHESGHNPSWLNNPDNFEDNDDDDDDDLITQQLLEEAKKHPGYYKKNPNPIEIPKDETDDPSYDPDAYREDD
jgi:hypothetical protein